MLFVCIFLFVSGLLLGAWWQYLLMTRPQKDRALGFIVTMRPFENEDERVQAYVAFGKSLKSYIGIYDLKLEQIRVDYPCIGFVVTGDSTDMEKFQQALQEISDITINTTTIR